MWQLQSIEATNFMSFEKVKYDFQKKCYIVKASNLDNDGQQSNGGGKTSFVDILPIALLGYSLTGRNVKDCVNWSTDIGSFTVSALMVNKEHNLKCYIERTIYSKSKSAELVLLLNEAVPSTVPTKAGVKNGVDVKEGNKYILNEILNISEDDLLNYFLISKSHYTPFLEVNTERKLEVISRFTNTVSVDKTIEDIEKKIKVDNQLLLSLAKEKAAAEGYIDALQSSISKEEEEKFIKNKEEQILKLEAKIDDLLIQAEAISNEIEIVVDSAALLTSEIKPVDVTKIAAIKNEIADYQQIITDLEELKTKNSNEAAVIRNYLAGLITCPDCGSQFNLKSKKKYKQTDLDALIAENVTYTEEQGLVKEEVLAKNSELDEYKVVEQKNASNLREISSLKRQIASMEARQTSYITDMDRIQAEIEELTLSEFSDNYADTLEKVQDKKEEIKGIDIQSEDAALLIDSNKKWIDRFSDFKFHLGNKPIEVICSLVNQYLKMSGSDLTLHIEGFKKLKSGELRQSLNPVIYRNWMNPQSYAQFSEGEKVRLNLAVCLAFQQLINSASKYGGLNLMINDEMISGLDSLGVKNVAEAFNQLGKTIILVTHSGADLVYENSITIEKKNLTSKLI